MLKLDPDPDAMFYNIEKFDGASDVIEAKLL